MSDKNLSELITGGYIITGGGALIKDLPELGEYILEKPTKIGYPRPFGGMTTIMQNPKFSTVLGLLLEASQANSGTLVPVRKISKNKGENLESDLLGRFSDSLKNVFKEIF